MRKKGPDVTPLEQRKEIVKAATELGRAFGLKQGAKLLRSMADHKGRVVGTNEIKDAAATLEKLADEIDLKSRAVLNAHGGTF